jgi:hypothetical protein
MADDVTEVIDRLDEDVSPEFDTTWEGDARQAGILGEDQPPRIEVQAEHAPNSDNINVKVILRHDKYPVQAMIFQITRESFKYISPGMQIPVKRIL